MMAHDQIFPIQIRPDLVVRFHGIPHDLTEAEAAKISRVITALASGRAPLPASPADASPREAKRSEAMDT